MTSSYSMVFSDLDDTFLAHDKSIPATNLRALDMLAEKGVLFVPCTGRSIESLPPAIASHPATSYVVAANGAVIYDVSSAGADVIRARRMTSTMVREAFDAISGLDVTFDVFADGHIFTNAKRFEHAMRTFGLDAGTTTMLRAVREPVDLPTPVIISSVGGEIDKVTVYWHDASTRERARLALGGVEGIAITSSHPRNVEFMATGVSKGEALCWVAKRTGIDIAATLAFGDSPNDADMLTRAGRGIAVANAAEDVRAVADEGCAGCDDGGPGKWLLGHRSLLSASPNACEGRFVPPSRQRMRSFSAGA